MKNGRANEGYKIVSWNQAFDSIYESGGKFEQLTQIVVVEDSVLIVVYDIGMVSASKYISTVKLFFDFLVKEFGFDISEETLNGNFFYRVRYINEVAAVTISYENIENFLNIFISILKDGDFPDYDDRSRTIPLQTLIRVALANVNQIQIGLNNQYFYKFSPTGDLEKKLLKFAKELRLCLKYSDAIKI